MTLVLTDRPEPSVARISLNRPERRNALGPDLRDALVEALEAALAEASVRAIVLTGAEGTFCAGGDISTMGGLDAAGAQARMAANHRLVRLLAGAEKPLVAAVEGFAMGAGAGIALWCDAIVMGQGARIGFPFLKMGLVPDYGLLFTLPRRVGGARARRLVLLAQPLSAAEAVAAGVVDRTVGDGEVQAAAIGEARALGAQAPEALARTKRLLLGAEGELEEVLRREAEAQAECFLSAEHAEGIAAFLEKRCPEF